MPPIQRFVVVVVGIALVGLIFELVRKRRLREEYSWLWILTGAGIFLLALTPFEVLEIIAAGLGSERPTAAIYFFAFIFLVLLCLQFSVRLSRMTEQVKTLAQKIALLEAQRPREPVAPASERERRG